MKFKSLFKNKITYFDLFFGIIFLTIILGVFLFFYRKKEYVNIRVKITDQDVLYANTNPKSWYANRFEVGDKEIDEIGRVIATITNVETFNISGDTKAIYLDIKIKAVYDRRTKLYSARGSNLIFGDTIKFNFSKVTFDGLITESPSTINQNGLSISEKEIVAVIRSTGSMGNVNTTIEPKVVEDIKKGDKITDSNGNVLAEVKDIVIIPGQRITQNDKGDILLRNDPYYKDAVLTLKVRVKEYKGEKFLFDNIPLRLGVYLPLNFDYVSVWPIIIKIQR